MFSGGTVSPLRHFKGRARVHFVHSGPLTSLAPLSCAAERPQKKQTAKTRRSDELHPEKPSGKHRFYDPRPSNVVLLTARSGRWGFWLMNAGETLVGNVASLFSPGSVTCEERKKGGFTAKTRIYPRWDISRVSRGWGGILFLFLNIFCFLLNGTSKAQFCFTSKEKNNNKISPAVKEYTGESPWRKTHY